MGLVPWLAVLAAVVLDVLGAGPMREPMFQMAAFATTELPLLAVFAVAATVASGFSPSGNGRKPDTAPLERPASRLDQQEADLAERIRAFLASEKGDGPEFFILLNHLSTRLSSLGVSEFGRRAATKEANFPGNPLSLGTRLLGSDRIQTLHSVFLLQALARKRFEAQAGTLQRLIQRPARPFYRRRRSEGSVDHLVLPVAGRTPEEIRTAASELLGIVRGMKNRPAVSIVLSDGAEAWQAGLTADFRGRVRFLRRSDLLVEGVAELFEPLRGRGRLNLVLERGDLPEWLIQALSRYAGDHPEIAERIRVILAHGIVAGALAISTTLPGVEALLEFEKTAQGHA